MLKGICLPDEGLVTLFFNIQNENNWIVSIIRLDGSNNSIVEA